MISRSNTKAIEAYLLGELSPMDQFLFEVKLSINSGLKREFLVQKKLFQLIRMYHREKQKEELKNLHFEIFSDPNKSAFTRSIYQIFE